MDDEDEGCREEPRERDGEGADGWGRGALCEKVAPVSEKNPGRNMGITTNAQNHDSFARHVCV